MVPAAIPVTTPVVEIAPTEGVLFVQVPPGVISPSAIVLPAQTFVGPVIAAGPGFTVTDFVTVQLVPPNE